MSYAKLRISLKIKSLKHNNAQRKEEKALENWKNCCIFAEDKLHLGKDCKRKQKQKPLKLGNLPEAMKSLKALIADVPYSNKKLASMDMEERYRLVLSTIFNAIGCRVEVEKMIATGRIDMVVETTNFIYVLELKLSNNGGIDAATEQIRTKKYTEPFKADKRKVVAIAIELDDKGKGLVDWKEV